MTEVPFHATRMGRTFFERTMPELVRQLAKLNENLERVREGQNDRDAATGHTADDAPTNRMGQV